CDADNLGDDQSILTSTHTNCLIRFVKERLAKRFASTEAAHSTAALLRVKRCFEVFENSLSFESFQLQQLTACLAACIAARRRIIRGLILESTPTCKKLLQACQHVASN
ncbi:hypothetical protein ACQKPE_22520, partial [Pseudomonas sp. NPDC089554]